MDALLERFDESVSLTVMTGQKVHCLLAAETRRPLCYRLGQGTGSLPYYASASGRAIVARLPQDEQEALLGQTRIEPLTPKTVRSKRALREMLARSRREGWSFQNEECELGVACVAVPILEGERPIAALAIIVPVIRFNARLKREMIAALKEAAG
jgi:DNA-binding IclR family transcriptional regulator